MSGPQRHPDRQVATRVSTVLLVGLAILPAACAPRVITKEQATLMRASLQESPFIRSAVKADCVENGSSRSDLTAEDYAKLKISPQSSVEEICEAVVEAVRDGRLETPNSMW